MIVLWRLFSSYLAVYSLLSTLTVYFLSSTKCFLLQWRLLQSILQQVNISKNICISTKLFLCDLLPSILPQKLIGLYSQTLHNMWTLWVNHYVCFCIPYFYKPPFSIRIACLTLHFSRKKISCRNLNTSLDFHAMDLTFTSQNAVWKPA
jgi:hypothetical protein